MLNSSITHLCVNNHIYITLVSTPQKKTGLKRDLEKVLNVHKKEDLKKEMR